MDRRVDATRWLRTLLTDAVRWLDEMERQFGEAALPAAKPSGVTTRLGAGRRTSLRPGGRSSQSWPG